MRMREEVILDQAFSRVDDRRVRERKHNFSLRSLIIWSRKYSIS